MRIWDLNTGAANLEDAMQKLQTARSDVAALWDDDTSRKFQEKHLDPLNPRVQRLFDAVHRLAHVLVRAQSECES